VTRSYFSLYAPTGVPKALLEKIATDVRSVAGETGFRERNLVRRGLEPVLSTPDEFAAFLKQDRAEARRVVDQSGLAPQ